MSSLLQAVIISCSIAQPNVCIRTVIDRPFVEGDTPEKCRAEVAREFAASLAVRRPGFEIRRIKCELTREDKA